MTLVVDVREHTFSADDKVFVDTNVLLFLHGPVVRMRERNLYSRALRDARQAATPTLSSVVVVQEFV